jgi:DNA-binding response OmpR family regulator
MRIGLLEDDPAICEMMQEILQTAGHNVTAYHDGWDILATFHLEEQTALPPLFDIVNLILS